jgi:hypothetical protein
MPTSVVQSALRSAAPTTKTARSRGKRSQPSRARDISTQPVRRCRLKFLSYYPKGFQDPDYVDLERAYKWKAHEQWAASLNEQGFGRLLRSGDFADIAARAVAIEARTNLLFSFEKMALRDAVKSREGAKAFAEGLFAFLHGDTQMSARFETWCGVLSSLPRRQTRVLTWPAATVFGFIAQPRTHLFLKPTVTRRAAARYGYSLNYRSRPQWKVYAELLRFARKVREDLDDMKPRDMIDIQSFLWVQGSDEYS